MTPEAAPYDGRMKVRVRMFGALAERAGRDEEVLELPAGATAGDVVALVGDRHPRAQWILGQLSVAVNHEVVGSDRALSDDDEVALLPPIAGGDVAVLVGLRERPSVDEALAAVASPRAGGTVVFLGTVRDHSAQGPVERLEYSAYREMAERVLRDVAGEAAGRWPLLGVAILHGTGDLSVGDPTVVVACSSAHRAEAFEACRYAIDEIKGRVPVWKKEVGPTGERWIGLEVPADDAR